MSIELHCPICRKLIRAPEEAAGKRGKCPYCKRDVYIPSPVEETEVIPLAPIDEEEERRAEELRRESIEATAALTREPVAKYDTGATPRKKEGSRPPQAAGPAEAIDIPAEVRNFVLAMRESKLDKAEQIADKLKRNAKRSRDYVQGLLVDQMPPNIGDIPEPLLRGFLKTLAGRLGK